jgi:hypothetical protein
MVIVLVTSPLLALLSDYQCRYGCHKVTTDTPVTTIVLLIQDTDVSMVAVPTVRSISCCQHSTAPRRTHTSALPSLFQDYSRLKFSQEFRTHVAGPSEKKDCCPPTKLHGVTFQNTTFSSVFDSFATNTIQSIFLITAVHREAFRTAPDVSKDGRRLQSITPTFISC